MPRQLLTPARRLAWQALLATGLALGLVWLLALVPLSFDALDPLKEMLADFSYTDLYYAELRQRPAAGATAPYPRLVLVNIGAGGLRGRAELAAVLRALPAYHPRAVGLDAYFLARPDSAGTAALAAAMRGLPLVVGVPLRRTPAGLRPQPLAPALRGVRTGFINFSGDDSLQTTIRHFRPFLHEADTVCVSWGARLVQLSGDTAAYATLRRRHPATAPEPEEIRYRGNVDSFYHLEAAELLGHQVNPEVLRDKVVLLGAMGERAGQPSTYEDLLFTPLNPRRLGRSRPDMYGVVVEANLVAMLLDRTYLTPTPWVLEWGLAAALGFGLMWLGRWVGERWPRWATPVGRVAQLALFFGLVGWVVWLYQARARSFSLTPSLAVVAILGEVLVWEAGGLVARAYRLARAGRWPGRAWLGQLARWRPRRQPASPSPPPSA